MRLDASRSGSVNFVKNRVRNATHHKYKSRHLHLFAQTEKTGPSRRFTRNRGSMATQKSEPEDEFIIKALGEVFLAGSNAHKSSSWSRIEQEFTKEKQTAR
jgi:hypothetical protein